MATSHISVKTASPAFLVFSFSEESKESRPRITCHILQCAEFWPYISSAIAERMCHTPKIAATMRHLLVKIIGSPGNPTGGEKSHFLLAKELGIFDEQPVGIALGKCKSILFFCRRSDTCSIPSIFTSI